jgi:hypothetical protein
MSTINQQPLADPLSLSDLIAIWSSGNSDTRRASLTALLALIQANIAFPSSSAIGQVVFLPFVGGTNNIIAQPAADVALPAAPAFGQTVEWIATGTNTGPATIQVTSSGGAQPVKAIQYRGDALIGGEIDAGGSCLAIYDGAAYQLVSSALVPTIAPTSNNGLINGYLDWTVAGNALTLAVKTAAGNDPTPGVPVYYTVRNANVGDGSTTLRSITAALNLVVPNGALLGTVSAIPFRLWGVVFNDAGVDRLGVINCLSTVANVSNGRNVTSIYPLGALPIGTSIAVSAAAALAQTFYTNNGVASKAYSVAGYANWETGLVTAGQWSANPTQKQLFGLGVPLPGQNIQTQRNVTGAVANGATAIPFDDTIPQNTEGTQFLTQAVTPSSAANVLVVSTQGELTNSGTPEFMTMALFQDAVAGAVAALSQPISNAEFPVSISLQHMVLAGATAATTFKMRAGSNSATNTTFNGTTSVRKLGAAMASAMRIEEVQA